MGRWRDEKNIFYFLFAIFCFLFLFPHSDYTNNDAEKRGDGGKYPGAHGDFRFWPAQSLEMMMNGRREEYFLSEESFRAELYGDTAGLEYIDEDDKEEDDGRIGQHGDDAERRPEGNRPRIAHEESRRVDIEPKESKEGAGDGRAKRCEIDLILYKRDDREGKKSEEEDTGIETVEPVRFIGGDGGKEDDEEKNRYIPETDLEIPDGRDMDEAPAEFRIEPP